MPNVTLSTVLSALSYALDLTEGQPVGHAARLYQLFGGDDQTVKHGLWTRDWRKWRHTLAYALD